MGIDKPNPPPLSGTQTIVYLEEPRAYRIGVDNGLLIDIDKLPLGYKQSFCIGRRQLCSKHSQHYPHFSLFLHRLSKAQLTVLPVPTLFWSGPVSQS